MTAAVLVGVLYAVILGVVYKKYQQTRNPGFLVLGFGVVVWPWADVLMLWGVRPTLGTNQNLTVGDLAALPTYAYQAVHAFLILAGLLLIGRSLRERHPHGQS